MDFILILTTVLVFSSSSNADLNNEVDPCSQIYNEGNCEGKIRRFYFNVNMSSCEEFDYSGCNGNENNFQTQEECVQTCLKKRDTRKVAQPDTSSTSYKMFSDFEWSAPAGSNARRRFPLAFCELEQDMGILCAGIRRGNYLEQFHYDSKANRCNSFVYNGCGGNANRFPTLWECTQSCVRKTVQQF